MTITEAVLSPEIETVIAIEVEEEEIDSREVVEEEEDDLVE